MTDTGPILVPHHVPAEQAREIATTLRQRLPDADVRIATTPAETDERVADAEVVLTYGFADEYLEAASNLEWIQAMSAGVDRYDFERLGERGIALTNASGIHPEPIAEQVFGYILSFERDLHGALRKQQRRVWQREDGTELRNKTIGIVGVGAIGERVAELGQAFGTTVIGTKRDTSEVPDAVDELLGSDDASLHEVCQRSDYLVLACPLTEETSGLIGRWELRMMKSDAVLVNIARGPVVEEDVLVRALQQDQIGGAALDVFETEPLPQESPLWNLSNVIVTPHMAGSTPHYVERALDIFVENYRRWTAGEELENRVV